MRNRDVLRCSSSVKLTQVSNCAGESGSSEDGAIGINTRKPADETSNTAPPSGLL
jgi:hypothetical protein